MTNSPTTSNVLHGEILGPEDEASSTEYNESFASFLKYGMVPFFIGLDGGYAPPRDIQVRDEAHRHDASYYDQRAKQRKQARTSIKSKSAEKKAAKKSARKRQAKARAVTRKG